MTVAKINFKAIWLTLDKVRLSQNSLRHIFRTQGQGLSPFKRTENILGFTLSPRSRSRSQVPSAASPATAATLQFASSSPVRALSTVRLPKTCMWDGTHSDPKLISHGNIFICAITKSFRKI